MGTSGGTKQRGRAGALEAEKNSLYEQVRRVPARFSEMQCGDEEEAPRSLPLPPLTLATPSTASYGRWIVRSRACSLTTDAWLTRSLPPDRIFLTLLIAAGAAAGGWVSVPKGENQV